MPDAQAVHAPDWQGDCGKDFAPLLKTWNALRNDGEEWSGPHFLAWLSARCDRLHPQRKYRSMDDSESIEEYAVMLKVRDAGVQTGPYTIWRIATETGRKYLRMAPPENEPDKRKEVQKQMRRKADVPADIKLEADSLTTWTHGYLKSKKAQNDWRCQRGFYPLLQRWNAERNRPLSGGKFLQLISAMCDAEQSAGRCLGIDEEGMIAECVVRLEDPARNICLGPFAVWQLVTESGDVFLRLAPEMPPGLSHLEISAAPEISHLEKLHRLSLLNALVDLQRFDLLRHSLTGGALTVIELEALNTLRFDRGKLRDEMLTSLRLSIGHKKSAARR